MQELISAALGRAVKLAAEWGLHPELAARLGVISVVMEFWNTPMPDIISGYRSPEKQAGMLQNWQAGKQVNQWPMPANKPAERSWHMFNYGGVPAALAVDVSSSSPGLPLFRALMMRLPYTQNPSNDQNHFEVELPLHRPPSI